MPVQIIEPLEDDFGVRNQTFKITFINLKLRVPENLLGSGFKEFIFVCVMHFTVTILLVMAFLFFQFSFAFLIKSQVSDILVANRA